jgi:hypothetical protein
MDGSGKSVKFNTPAEVFSYCHCNRQTTAKLNALYLLPFNLNGIGNFNFGEGGHVNLHIVTCLGCARDL